ncbi:MULTISPECIES: DUF5703 family protein [Arthrobacter]|uniref:DUF5703 family protein n=1 Tax=Arthrobacter jinronghuae TaxID=2964609 RepID=A0ABT1NR47_9MICC|nr:MULTISPECIES: DUF5703 family protein [Arthrobacter]MCC9174651.1 DUF5703 family protein [Arthrobacter sp. zg-Y179]MCQ1947018.1 DUF5703 family protein [Arthrobacter sp. zg-Y1116]MCQ1950208.1 DUF5703 family protein [Arthrobacter jinronghuae]MCQ1953393.1 DUF5703 family protein [Arthrobacter sp. zg-Y238]MCQ1956627.1 DUF5703 family protein [Arthrobacter jinronghuae]
MREQILAPDVSRRRENSRDYEYLVVSVDPNESLPDARRRLVEHAEYGKWELHRSRIYSGGGRRFWLRRRVLRVQRTT